MADTFYWNGYCSANRDEALFCLFNNETTDLRRYFTITRFEAKPLSPVVTTGANTEKLFKITALSGGDTIPTVKADSSSTDIPSQVLFKLYPSYTASSVVRNCFPQTISTAGLSKRGTGLGLNSSSFWSSGFVNSTTQRIILREGEGIAVGKTDSISSAHSHTMHYNVTFLVGSSTHYATFTAAVGNPSEAAFGILNGSGSGVALEVVSIEITEVGQQTSINALIDSPYLRFVRAYGYDGGESITPTTLSTATSSPSALVMRRNQAWAPLTVSPSVDGVGAGELAYPESNQTIYRKIGTFRQTLMNTVNNLTVGGATGSPVFSEFTNSKTAHGMKLQGDSNTTGIVLRPQDVFAVIVNNASPYSTYQVEIEFTHTAPPAGGGSSEHAYTFVA